MSIKYGRVSVNYQNHFLISVDPSINMTGVAVYRFKGQEVSLVDMKLIESGKDLSDDRKACEILRLLKVVVSTATQTTRQLPCVVIEVPPDTIYNSGKISKSMIIARAKSVYRTYAIAFCCMALADSMSLQTAMMLPSQWQGKVKKATGKKEGKEASLIFANDLIKKSHYEFWSLKTKKDQNIADAICMGYIACRKLIEEGEIQ